MIRFLITILIIFLSIEMTSQCLSSNDILIQTTKSCGSLDSGILSIENLKKNNHYDVILNEVVYSSSTDTSGIINIYSLAPGVYEKITINDKTNPCPEIKIEESIVIGEWSNSIEGPTSACRGEIIKLNSSSASTWSIDSIIINSNAPETSLAVSDQNSITLIAEALIEGCSEKDTINVQVNDTPQVDIISTDKNYCYNKQHEIVELNISHGELTQVYFNDELVLPYESNKISLNLGDVTDNNILSVTAESDAKCVSTTDISLPILGEAPTDDIEILWWPGNIFSIKNDNPQLRYRWGWINLKGEIIYAISQMVSSDGKHYFAGSRSAEVVDLMLNGESSSSILFVEYRNEGEECFNRLLFNSSKMPLFRNRSQDLIMSTSMNSFPNPFQETVTISSSEISGFEELALSITDSSGRSYYQNKIEVSNGFMVNISTSQFPRGAYFIQLSHNGFTLLSNKVIKQ